MRRRRQRIWFERWVREGYSLRQLSQQSGLPRITLRRIVHHWLAHPPQPTLELSLHRHLIVDSTYLRGRRAVVTVVMNARTNTAVAGSYGVHEAAGSMQRFCAQLAQRGLRPTGITTDGSPTLVRYLRAQWPDAVLQRCLVHLQRQGLSWCRQRPTRADAQQLRRLFRALIPVCSRQARDRWIERFVAWEQHYGWRIDLCPERGWVFSDLKRARSSVVNALADMFHYLDHPGLASTSNGLEGYFSRLKPKYRQHRGLSRRHRQAYIHWYLHLCLT